jgi:hypothetical protein
MGYGKLLRDVVIFQLNNLCTRINGSLIWQKTKSSLRWIKNEIVYPSIKETLKDCLKSILMWILKILLFTIGAKIIAALVPP